MEELKRQFSVQGIPAEAVSDYSHQFSRGKFQEFAKDNGFKHTTMLPHYPKANTDMERAVQECRSSEEVEAQKG